MDHDLMEGSAVSRHYRELLGEFFAVRQ